MGQVVIPERPGGRFYVVVNFYVTHVIYVSQRLELRGEVDGWGVTWAGTRIAGRSSEFVG